MAGRYVYNAAGQKVWTEDSTQPGVPQAPPSPGGLSMGGSDATGKYPSNITGLPGYYRNLELARLMWENSADPNQINAAQASPVEINRAAELATRAKQYDMLAGYDQMAQGGGPSVAGYATREGMDATARAMMASKGGLRGTLGAGSAMGMDTALKGASMKASEQQGAWGALNSAASGVRAQDIQGNTEVAKLYQQMGLANAGFKQQAAGANQDAQLAMLGNRAAAAAQYGGLVADNRTARTTRWGIGVQEAQGDLRKRLDDQDRDDREVAAAINTGAKIVTLGASDARVKTDVKGGDADLHKMYASLAPYEYEYKDPNIDGASPGRHVSVMAQDLEKSEIGKRAVSTSPEGHKMVDYAKLLPAQVAATAMLYKEVQNLKKQVGKR